MRYWTSRGFNPMIFDNYGGSWELRTYSKWGRSYFVPDYKLPGSIAIPDTFALLMGLPIDILL